ncbi:MAG: imidazole glycerol phosphate synthase subunit HisH [Bacteroidetes bacterium]|nr:MAG: imidazole glycerol phosphate synthase subunit HisH [Bacteroidota bacterium]
MIAIINYNAGNTRSVENALSRLGYTCTITSSLEELQTASKVIFPGVGEARSAMKVLKDTGIDKLLPTLTQPVLGICLGMQLMCDYSEEGNTRGLGIFPIVVRHFPPSQRVPHMGWNTMSNFQSPLFTGITESDDFYFVHSYKADVSPYTIATCNYIEPFSAAINKNNFYATQFHPEKSGDVGMQLLKNFIEL